jgi:hypothetical protein
MKVCRICKIEKNYSEFHKLKSSKDGHRYECKECRHKESIENRDKKKEYNQNYFRKNKPKLLKKNKEYREENADKINIQRKEYRNKPENKKHIEKKNKEYLPIRKEKIKERRKTDISFRLSETFRSKMHRALKNKNKEKNSVLLGCTNELFLKWLEFQFNDEINWNNYGSVWQIDHIIPINMFEFNDNDEKFICFNWKNLQPLVGTENREKSDTFHIKYVQKMFINLKNFVLQNNLDIDEYYSITKQLYWLRNKLRQSKKFKDDVIIINKMITEIDNPQSSSDK